MKEDSSFEIEQVDKPTNQFSTPSQFFKDEDFTTADTLQSVSNFESEEKIKYGNVFEVEETQRLTQQMSDFSLSQDDQKSLYTFQKMYPGFANQTTSNKMANDRFIPNRKSSKLHLALTGAHETDENKINPEQLKGKDYKEQNQLSVLQLYKAHVLGINNVTPNETGQHNNNIFRYKDSPNRMKRQPLSNIQDVYINNNIVNQYQQPKKQTRKISKIPYKVLDAPSLQDDFYLNLVDWSQQNQLAVALASCVYLWSANNNKVVKFCDLGLNDMVTSVTWNPRGTVLCIGTSFGDIQIWDAVKLKKCCTLGGHTARVGSLAWSNIMLSSGSRDKTILQRDLRTELNYVKKYCGHKQEVCGLKWSYDDQQLASGGNDNKLYVWNLHNTNPVAKFSQHCAAVKALAWSPHQHGLLASGGGTADRTIRFWNTLNNQQLDHYDTGSQVCNLLFSKNVNEVVSTHGYSLNQVVIWKYPTMEKIVDLTGHTSRVLFLSMSPDGETIVTGAGDETLRFWNVFPKKNEGFERSSLLVGNMRDLR